MALGVITLLELLLWLPVVWRWRVGFAWLLITSLPIASVALIITNHAFWTFLLLFFSAYRVINLFRLIEARTQADRLFHTARQASLWLICMQLVVFAAELLTYHFQLRTTSWLYLVAVAQVLAAGVVAASARRQLRKTQPPAVLNRYADRDLPTLTVAIPARNETADLEECLRSLISCNYPKLEILVLDDCSQERRTPEIIRGFAHDGVRFIAGEVPPEHWLAKNYAYEQLRVASSGDVLLFCGVDVRFSPESLRNLVEIMLQKKKSMLSLIPANRLPDSRWGLESLLVQPSRYAWELALPRRWFNRPPVLSTCWLITRQALMASGGFQAVTHSSSPESYFARQTAKRDDGYSFMQSDAGIGLQCLKSLDEQRSTAIRMRYPQLHRRPELTALVTLAEFSILIAPFITLFGSFITGNWLLGVLSALACFPQLYTYASIVNLTYRQPVSRGYVLLPFAVLYDIALLNLSMWRYEFSEVIWKDRNICVPVMHTFPALPKV